MNILHKLKSRFKEPKEVERLEIIEENCVGCGKCVEMCKREVFAMAQSKAIVANLKSCVGCGKCIEKICNFGAIDLVVKTK